MDSRRAGGVAIFGIGVLLVIWGLLTLIPTGSPGAISQNATALQHTRSSYQEITVHRTEKSGLYTYRGLVVTPSACDTLSIGSTVVYGEEPKLVAAIIVEDPVSGVTCAQKPAEQEFSVGVMVKTSPHFAVTINGTPANVRLIED